MNPTPTPQPFPLCSDVTGDLVGCCLVAIPNTSQWEVQCADPAAQGPVSVPVLSGWGSLILGLSLVAVALRRLR